MFLFFAITCKAQSYAPAAGFKGSSAIYKDSSIFIDWAKDVQITTSYKNIAFPENGLVEYGKDTCAIGKAAGNPNVVSLGDGGSAILTFNYPIVNGEGSDFAIFENGFFENDTSELAFLEFAFVEVSTNGIDFIRFPAISEIQNETQVGSFDKINASYVHNLAGKYTMFYGTPFDLDDLKDLAVGSSINLNEINYIKVIDVIGTVNEEFATYDSKGNIINDPYPTAFASGGFDLDAVGVINNKLNTNVANTFAINPNPAKEIISVKGNSTIEKINIYSVEGKLVISTTKNYDINIQSLEEGVYIMEVINDKEKHFLKFIKR